MLFKNNQTTRWNQPLPLYLRIQHKFPWMYMINVFVPLIYLYLILCMNLFQLAVSSFSILASFQFWHLFEFWHLFKFGVFFSLASFSILLLFCPHPIVIWLTDPNIQYKMNELQSGPFWDLRDLKKERQGGRNLNFQFSIPSEVPIKDR